MTRPVRFGRFVLDGRVPVWCSRAVLLLTVLAGAASAWAAPARLVRLVPEGSALRMPGLVIGLGEADDAGAPRAWLGPMRIARRGRASCTVDRTVSIIEGPFDLLDGRMLFVRTYSGSETTLFVVDVGDCAVRWISPVFTGPVKLTAGQLRLPGRAPMRIGADGMPVSR